MIHEPLILSRSITLSSNREMQQQYSYINNNKLVDDTSNNTGPYVRHRFSACVNESNTPALVSISSSLPSPTKNFTITSTSNSIDESTNGKRRTNLSPNCDEEAEAKPGDQQIKNRSNETNDLLNNKIGTPSTPLANSDHDIETELLQKVVEEKKKSLENKWSK
ncbi:unnamed protein product [Rotaria sp. Silwood1]|nr:unnamed protein product [Rotaria sp. Silwood1]CAF1445210.1 unnamed protein product [Rotaria sp. Silwood1]CAF1448222.1 unnamed protein product [Rotaria sp. Silwood1]